VFLPLLRIFGAFVVAVGFLACVGGTYLLLGSGTSGRIVYLYGIGAGLLALGYWLRAHGGEGDLVGVEPDEIEHDFRIAVAYGLGAHAPGAVTALAGAGASAAVVLFVALLGFISPGAFAWALLLFGAYGALLALLKKAALRRGAFVVRNGKRYGAHRRVSVYVVPAMVIAWLVATAPEVNGAIVLAVALILLAWIGGPFHHLWEVFHTAALVLYYGEHSKQTTEWGLAEWLRYVRPADSVRSLEYDPEAKRLVVEGEIRDAQEFSRVVGRLDFVSDVVTR